LNLNKRTLIGIMIVVILLSLIWIILTPVLFPPAQASVLSAPHAGFNAPDFSLSTPANESISLSDLEGQPVLVLFWASWCSVCKAIMPGLQEVYADFAEKGFEILAVNATNLDSLPAAIEYFQSQGYTYPMLIDEAGIASRSYQVRALPTAILVNPDGSIRDLVIGSGLSEGYLRSELLKILDERE